jgi:alpha-glucosidase
VNKPKSSSYLPKTDLQLEWGNSPSFWFEVQRKSTKEVLFTTQNSKLVFENQFIEFVTDLPQNYNVTGLGEHMHGLQLQPGFVATNWNADIGDPIDSNMYGTHAFLLDTRYDASGSSSHGLWWRNSHGLEAVFGQQNLTWRAIGGSVELYFLDGPNPADVTAQYTQGVVGLPQMQQYWTLGLHQCHWGCKSQTCNWVSRLGTRA